MGIENFVWIVGMYRSGTTLLQRVLNVHDECLILGEQQHLLMLQKALYVEPSNTLAKEQRELFVQDPNCWQANLGSDVEHRAEAGAAYMQRLFFNSDFMQYLGKDPEKVTCTGAKMVAIQYTDLPLLKGLVPSSKIVYVYRDFPSVAKSYIKQPWSKYYLTDLFKLWCGCILSMKEYAEHLDCTLDYNHDLTLDKLMTLLPQLGITPSEEKIQQVLDTRIVYESKIETDHDVVIDREKDNFIVDLMKNAMPC